MRISFLSLLSLSLLFSFSSVHASVFVAPLVSGKKVDGCIDSPSFPSSAGNQCSKAAQQIIIDSFCRIQGEGEGVAAVAELAGSAQDAVKLQYVEQAPTTVSTWINSPTSTYVFTSITCQKQNGFGALRDFSKGASYATVAATKFQTRSALPTSLDNRHLFPPIKNQGGCGSCTVFASTALLEAAIQRDYGVQSGGPLDTAPLLKEQLTIDCGLPACVGGWTMPQALSNVVELGATNWEKLSGGDGNPIFANSEKYVPQPAQCIANLGFLRNDPARYAFRPYEYQKFGNTTLEEFKSAIHNYGAVATTLMWSPTVLTATGKSYAFSGYCPPPPPNGSNGCGGHAVSVAGYDDTRRAFLVRNSWGSINYSGHEAGYIWISYDEYSPVSKSQFGWRDGGFYVIQRRPEIPTQYSPALVDGRPRLSIALKGAGIVEATSGAQLSCTPICSARVEVGTRITLQARPSAGNAISGWKGCTPSGSNQCVLTVAKDTTVSVEFATTTPSSSEYDPGLLNALGDVAAQALQIAPALYGSTQNLIVERGISKYDTLVVDERTIRFDPSFSVSDGRYNAATNEGVSALVIKYLQVPRVMIPATGLLEITFSRDNSSSKLALNGAVGAPGSTGRSPLKPEAGQGHGENGGAGGNGGHGKPGMTRQYDATVLISVGTVIDNLGKVIPPEKIRFHFDFGGYDGGGGGNGGRGGDGGKGADGGDGEYSFFKGCTSSPGNGGVGGTGGVGGDGGDGGDAGSGANLVVFLPPTYSSSLGSLNVSAGVAGKQGFAANSGKGGLNGVHGARPGSCTGGSNGSPGATPNNIATSARAGLPGAIGQLSSASFLRAGEHAAQVASAGVAYELLASTSRLVNIKITNILQDKVQLSWVDTNPSLGQVTGRLLDGRTVVSMSVSSGPVMELAVPQPGSYQIELSGSVNKEITITLVGVANTDVKELGMVPVTIPDFASVSAIPLDTANATLVANIDKVFAWAEGESTLFQSTGNTSKSIAGFRYRVYQNRYYLAVNDTGEPHLYYFDNASMTELLDLGSLADFLGLTAN